MMTRRHERYHRRLHYKAKVRSINLWAARELDKIKSTHKIVTDLHEKLAKEIDGESELSDYLNCSCLIARIFSKNIFDW